MLPVTSLPRNKRNPGRLQELAPVPPPWSRWLLIPPLAIILALGALIWETHRPPSTVDEVRLAGPRSPAAISLVLFLDESGSFEGYDQVRRQTLESIMTWSQENLRPDDALTVISFAGSAGTKVKTTTIADLAAGRITPESPTVGGGTSVQPALDLAGKTTLTNRTQSLIVLTDTIIDDAHEGPISDAMKSMNASSMSLIIPDGLNVTREWEKVFPYELVIHAPADSADQGALAIAKAAAHATGQSLEKIR
ncbi:VWA domain-containing protein (plasmid) [Arthrobacter sp. G.S.26]|uniref:VWA domain-containing protein n=1 Tax=Arthrobacter sp. G.S.26 TaxID=3433706 RepID=UPI003D782E03